MKKPPVFDFSIWNPLKKIFKPTSKEVDLKIYEPEKWFEYNVDCKEQYISIYNLKLKNKDE